MADESKQSKRNLRERQILSATLRLVRHHGCDISTAQIAAEAHCSKETLYNWFGDRDGIMLALVLEQAAGMRQVLDAGFAGSTGSVEDRLKAGCTLLLDIMTGEAVLAVNRVAMSQVCRESAKLGAAVLADWHASVVTPFENLFREGTTLGAFTVGDKGEAFEVLTGLLIGDRQRRLLLGDDARPESKEMTLLADQAVERWLNLYT